MSGAGGSNQAYKIACRLVHGFKLDDATATRLFKDEYNPRCEPPWSEKEVAHKIADARTRGDSRNYLDEPRRNGGIETNGHAGAACGPADRGHAARAEDRYGCDSDGNPTDPEDDEDDEPATLTDAAKEIGDTTWMWPDWIPRGRLACIAAEEGVGKTRLCADLARRMIGGLSWPDGQEIDPEFVGRPVLWVPSDSHHGELKDIMDEFGIDTDLVILNTPRKASLDNLMLDEPRDLKRLERYIRRCRPAIVFVDTVMGATELSMSKTEEARRFFAPLQAIAQRTKTSILCVTHLNATGQALGRRIKGAVRSLIKLECPDPEGLPDRRKAWVDKSSKKKPPPLGVTMFGHGNEYDQTPPEKPDAAPGKPNRPSKARSRAKMDAAIEWLQDNLPGRVSALRQAWEAQGHSTTTMYAAFKEIGGVEDEDDRKRKCWSLPTS